MLKHLTVKIYGQVQAVGFRYSAGHVARQLGITGFARNEPDGSVYIEAEGEEVALKDFLSWCGKGPQLARVEKVDPSWPEVSEGFTGFKIK